MPRLLNVIQGILLPRIFLISPLLARVRQFSNLVSSQRLASWTV
jgi:hypothetical protein